MYREIVFRMTTGTNFYVFGFTPTFYNVFSIQDPMDLLHV
jgi:hypothetical protein